MCVYKLLICYFHPLVPSWNPKDVYMRVMPTTLVRLTPQTISDCNQVRVSPMMDLNNKRAGIQIPHNHLASRTHTESHIQHLLAFNLKMKNLFIPEGISRAKCVIRRR